MMPKKVLLSIPLAMLDSIDSVAKAEHRTRSELLREAFRRYIESFKRNHISALALAGDLTSTAPVKSDAMESASIE